MIDSVQVYSSVATSTLGRSPRPSWLGRGLVVLAVCLALPGASWGQTKPASPLATELQSILAEQRQAWNRGDLETFMEYYWKSDELTFSSGGKTARGWQATLDRYHQTYRSENKMGHLEFSELEVTPLGDGAALMLGRWQLSDNGAPSTGNFSLVWRKIDGKWRIIHDHSSQTPAAQQ